MTAEKILKLIQNKFIYGRYLSILIAALSVALLPVMLFALPIRWQLITVVSLSSVIIYLYNRYKEDAFKKRIYLVPALLFLFTLIDFAILLSLKNFTLFIFSAGLVFIGILYTIFFKKITKQIIGFKNFFVALCWGAIILFSSLFYSLTFEMSLLLIFSFVVINTFLHEILLDMRDITEDEKKRLLTLPIVCNKNKQKLILFLVLINILSCLPIIYGTQLGFLPNNYLILVLSFFYSIFLILRLTSIYPIHAKTIEPMVHGGKILWILLVIIV